MERLFASASSAPPSADGIEMLELARSLARWMMFWVVSFYALSVSRPLWAGRLAPSTKAHENNRYWEARNVIGIIHAALVSILAVPVAVALSSAPEEVRFASSGYTATCAQSAHPEWNVSGQAVALAGVMFSSFIAADLIISAVHRLATPDLIVHHVAFLTAGLIIRSNCMLPFNAAVLLAMEASTPVLNLMLLLRNRGPAYATTVTLSGTLFFLSYVVFRLALNTVGAALLWRQRDVAMPAAVPLWQRWFLLLAIAAGTALQYFWFSGIAKIFGAGIAQLVASKPAAAEASGGTARSRSDSGDAPSEIVRLRSRSGGSTFSEDSASGFRDDAAMDSPASSNASTSLEQDGRSSCSNTGGKAGCVGVKQHT